MIKTADHGNPHRAAAARQLEVPFFIDVLVKFQRFLERQDIGKDSHFEHPRKAQHL